MRGAAAAARGGGGCLLLCGGALLWANSIVKFMKYLLYENIPGKKIQFFFRKLKHLFSAFTLWLSPLQCPRRRGIVNQRVALVKKTH